MWGRPANGIQHFHLEVTSPSFNFPVGGRNFSLEWVYVSLRVLIKCCSLHSTRFQSCLSAGSKGPGAQPSSVLTGWQDEAARGGAAWSWQGRTNKGTALQLQWYLLQFAFFGFGFGFLWHEDILDFSSTSPLPPPRVLSGLEWGRGGKCSPSSGTALHNSLSTRLQVFIWLWYKDERQTFFLCKAFCLIKGLLWLNCFLRRALFKIRVMGYYNSREEHLQRNILHWLEFLWNTTKYKIDLLISVAILKTYY